MATAETTNVTSAIASFRRPVSHSLASSDPLSLSKPNPHEFIGCFERLEIACSLRWRQAEQFWSLKASYEPAPCWFWKQSRCAIKSRYWSAAELVARASVVGTGCFGSCCRAGGRNGAKVMIVQPETVLHWRRNGWSALWRHRSRGSLARRASKGLQRGPPSDRTDGP